MAITIQYNLDRVAKVTAGSMARRFLDLNSWEKARVAARITFDNLGEYIEHDITGTPRFWLGMLSNPAAGMTNGPLTASTSHFVGLRTGAPTWIWTDTSPRYALPSPSGLQVGKRVGSTDSFVDAGVTAHVSAQPETRREILVVEITKGSPNYSFQTMAINATGDNTLEDLGDAYLVVGLEQLTLADCATYFDTNLGTTHDLSAVLTQAVDTSVDGVLNSLCIGWSHPDVNCHISDVGAVLWT